LVLGNQVSFDRLNWPVVVSAYLLVAVGAIALRLQMASMFGFDFLGGWRPSNTNDFRQVCSIAFLLASGLAIVLVVFAAIRGRGPLRIAAISCPIFAFVLFWLLIVA
jgi:hypothetical protein